MKHLNLSKIVASCLLILLASPLASEQVHLGHEHTMVYPLMATRVSSSFGVRKHPIYKVRAHHYGIDLAAPNGAQVRAVAAGTVVYADPHSGYGNLVVVLHKNGQTSHYGHMHSIHVEPGTIIKAGEIIGTVGSTGNVTGPHLHLEIRENGKALDPKKLFPKLAAKAKG